MSDAVTWQELALASEGAIVVSSEGQVIVAEKYTNDLLLFAVDLARFAYKAQETKNEAGDGSDLLTDFAAPTYSTPAYDAVNGHFTTTAVANFSRLSTLTIN